MLMSDEETIQYLDVVKPIRAKLKEIAHQAGMEISEMALRYALSIDDCTSIVIGVETSEQIKDNVRLANKGPLPIDILTEIRRTVPDLPESILLPVNWPKS